MIQQDFYSPGPDLLQEVKLSEMYLVKEIQINLVLGN